MEARYYKEITAIRAGGVFYEVNEDRRLVRINGVICSVKANGEMIEHYNIEEVHVSLRSIELLGQFKVSHFYNSGALYKTNDQTQYYHMDHGPWSLAYKVGADSEVVYFQGATNVKK